MEKTEKLTRRECIFGDKNFYRHVLAVVLPIIVQNTLTNVVSLLDNVMVGQVGTLPMSGVAIVGQLIFVYNLKGCTLNRTKHLEEICEVVKIKDVYHI